MHGLFWLGGVRLGVARLGLARRGKGIEVGHGGARFGAVW